MCAKLTNGPLRTTKRLYFFLQEWSDNHLDAPRKIRGLVVIRLFWKTYILSRYLDVILAYDVLAWLLGFSKNPLRRLLYQFSDNIQSSIQKKPKNRNRNSPSKRKGLSEVKGFSYVKSFARNDHSRQSQWPYGHKGEKAFNGNCSNFKNIHMSSHVAVCVLEGGNINGLPRHRAGGLFRSNWWAWAWWWSRFRGGACGTHGASGGRCRRSPGPRFLCGFKKRGHRSRRKEDIKMADQKVARKK